MSGIGEFAYTVLLGWMRGLFDWLWSLFAGGGGTGALSWFLSNWKVWLLALLLGGLVVDWLMWVVRWRPYRLLLGRFRRVEPAGEAERWDDGVGYYAAETAEDTGSEEWTETTFATLSEIDPDWAGDMFEREGAEEPLYAPGAYAAPAYDSDAYEDAPAAGESAYASPLWSEASSLRAEDEAEADEEGVAVSMPDGQRPPSGFDPFAPYDAYSPEDVAALEVNGAETARDSTGETAHHYFGRSAARPGAHFPFMALRGAQENAPDALGRSDGTDESDVVGEVNDSVEPAPYDPLFNADTSAPLPPPRRRRRRIRERAQDVWQPEDAFPGASAPPEPADASWETSADTGERYAHHADPRAPWPDEQEQGGQTRYDAGHRHGSARNPLADTRPSRVVYPASQTRAEQAGQSHGRTKKRVWDFRTVTGKPAKPRGLRRLTSMQEEAISGLPPLDLTDPFLPAARPDDVDFAPDEGEEFDR